MGNIFYSAEEKMQQARNDCVRRAVQYKANCNFNAALNEYQMAADMSKGKDDHDYIEDLNGIISTAIKSDNFIIANKIIPELVEIYIKSNSLLRAAKILEKFGLWKPTNGSFTKAQQNDQRICLERAIKLYNAEENTQTIINEIVVRLCEMDIANEEYISAAIRYEEIGKKILANGRSRLTFIKYFFMCLLCYIASFTHDNMIEHTYFLHEKFKELADLDSLFNEYTPEYLLISKILSSFDDNDLEEYQDAVSEFSQIRHPDQLKRDLLKCGERLFEESPN